MTILEIWWRSLTLNALTKTLHPNWHDKKNREKIFGCIFHLAGAVHRFMELTPSSASPRHYRKKLLAIFQSSSHCVLFFHFSWLLLKPLKPKPAWVMFSLPCCGVLPILTFSRTITEPVNPDCMCHVLFIRDSLSGEVSCLHKQGREPLLSSHWV